MRLRALTTEAPDLSRLSFDERWKGPDGGLVFTWTTGLELASRNHELSRSALRGELPVLPWKGGVDKPIKGTKIGALHYLAMWQGLRNEDLDIDTEASPRMRCSRTGVQVVFTGDVQRLLSAGEETSE